jgi:hypothetical protein
MCRSTGFESRNPLLVFSFAGYLQVVTWQTAALNNPRNDLNILERRLDASGWPGEGNWGRLDTSRMPRM